MSSLQDSITYKGKRVVFKNMALYALGDMHLSFMAHKPMDKFGKVWKNHEEKIDQLHLMKLLAKDQLLKHYKMH